MPKVGDAMTEGKVVRWYKQAGEKVTKGEPVLEIETDKVNLDLEAEADGTLGELAAKDGEVVPVGGLLANILAAGEKDAPRAAKKKDAAAAAAPPAEPQPQEQRRATDKKDGIKHSTGEYGETLEMKGPRVDRTSAPSPGTSMAEPPASGDGGRRKSSPLARKMARELGVSLDAVQGSGPAGRIVASDIKNAGTQPQRSAAATAAPTASTKPAAPALKPAPALTDHAIPLSAMRRTIAKRLAESTGPIPHFYLTVEYDVTNLVSVRQQLLDITGSKISVNDFLVRAVALALRHHPNINASWGDDAISQHGEVHIGIAVATPEGLITPVIRNAVNKSVVEIAG